jgi:hypothetical protein
MKTNKIANAVAVALTIIAACWIMGAPAGAEAPPPYEISPISNQIYQQIPNLWEYLQANRIEWTEIDEAAIEPNNAETEATVVTDGTQVNGMVDAAGDVNDYFMVELTEPSTLIAQLKWTNSAWLNLYIYDSAMEPITYLNENTPSPKVLSFWQHDAGTYYIRVKAIAGASSYTLKVAVGTQIGEPDNDAYDTTGTTISAVHVPVKSVVADGVDGVDYYKVNIPGGCEGASVTLDWLGSSDANLDFEILNDMGTKLMTADSSSNYETVYSQNVPQGTYYIAVKAIAGRAVYQLDVDADINLRIDIPIYMERVPIWQPPFPEFRIDQRIRQEIQ